MAASGTTRRGQAHALSQARETDPALSALESWHSCYLPRLALVSELPPPVARRSRANSPPQPTQSDWIAGATAPP